MRPIALVLLSSACAATVTFVEAIQRFPLARPERPLTTQDTIVALAIREAALGGLPDFPPRRHVVVKRVPELVSSRALPHIDSVSFFLLEPDQMSDVADQVGPFLYLRPTPPRVDGDTALVGVATDQALKRGPRHFLWEAGCSWRAVRRAGAWVIDTVLGCFVV